MTILLAICLQSQVNRRALQSQRDHRDDGDKLRIVGLSTFVDEHTLRISTAESYFYYQVL